ncbi:hypothetical protein VNO80_21718 [Phaseolus coccineus]|uniref:Uncharacterized protein n=1 Tax=Phaseolus coccineus TaxID=3886 RepID=A0AAN9M3K2_PHACN
MMTRVLVFLILDSHIICECRKQTTTGKIYMNEKQKHFFLTLKSPSFAPSKTVKRCFYFSLLFLNCTIIVVTIAYSTGLSPSLITLSFFAVISHTPFFPFTFTVW